MHFNWKGFLLKINLPNQQNYTHDMLGGEGVFIWSSISKTNIKKHAHAHHKKQIGFDGVFGMIFSKIYQMKLNIRHFE